MKRAILSLMAIWGLLLSSLVMAAGQDVVNGKYTPGFYSTTNFVLNPSCTNNTNNISVTSTMTVSRTTTTPIEAPASCLLTGGVTIGSKATFAASTMNLAQKGQNCEARLIYYGDGTGYKAYVNLGSTKSSADYSLVDSSSSAKLVSISFPCGDNSSAPSIVFESTAATPSSIRVASAYVGSATNVASAYGLQDYDWTSYTPILGAGFGTPTNVSFFHRRVGGNLEVKGSFTTGTTAASLGTISLPGTLAIDTTKININNTSANPGQSVGVFYGQGAAASGPIVTATGTSTTVVYTGDKASSSTQLTPTNANSPIFSSAVLSVNFTLPIAGWSTSNSGTVIKPEAQAIQPAGEVMAFSGASCPTNWIAANGAAVSRSTYAQLFNRIGVTNGSGDGSTTFNVPDYRGVFLRGANSFASIDASGTAASNNVTATAHGINRTGYPVRVTGTPVTGLSTATTYYAIVVDANTLAFASSHANALAGTKITISGSAASMTVAQWIDPDTRLAITPGGATSGAGSFQYGQVESHSHNYDASANPYYMLKTTGGAVGLTSGSTLANSSTGTQATGGNETRPLNVSVNYCVRAYDLSAPSPILVGANYTPGTGGAVENFSVSYGTSTATGYCTASPCSYLDQVGSAVTSISRTSSGLYVLNTAKTYSKLKCSAPNGIRSAGSPLVTCGSNNPGQCANCNSLTFSTCAAGAETPADSFGTILCQGQP